MIKDKDIINKRNDGRKLIHFEVEIPKKYELQMGTLQFDLTDDEEGNPQFWTMTSIFEDVTSQDKRMVQLKMPAITNITVVERANAMMKMLALMFNARKNLDAKREAYFTEIAAG